MQEESFGKRLHRLRNLRNLSVREMAEKIQVPVSTYRDWEYGREIKGEPYARIAQALSVNISELFGVLNEEENMQLLLIQTIEEKLLALVRDLEQMKPGVSGVPCASKPPPIRFFRDDS